MNKIILIVIVVVLLGALGAALFVEAGVYNIGADDRHMKAALALITQLRDRSIETRLGAIKPQLAATPAMIKTGAEHYAALCVGCHLAPGLLKSELRTGLYPRPPNLAQEDIQESRRAFWIIKHGIKMSAMPAWGKTLDDAAIWEVVAFVRKMPSLTGEDYQQLAQRR
ncbi:MAG: cytochrome c [Steroidobacteraceae bacterium]